MKMSQFRMEMNKEYQEKIDILKNVINMLEEEDKRFVVKVLKRMMTEWKGLIKDEGENDE